MTDRTQPDSASTTGSTHIIRYALELGLRWVDGDGRDKVREALDALDTLEAQLEAIGAGGVSGPLMGIAAPPTAQAEGWRLVPLEPTDEMLNATYAGQHCSDVYRDMLAAAPTHPASAEGVEHG